MRLRNIKIGIRLALGFAVIITLGMAISVSSFINMSPINSGIGKVLDNGVVPVKLLGDIDAGIKQVKGDVYRFYMYKNLQETLEPAISSEFSTINEEIAAYRTNLDTEFKVNGDSQLTTSKQNELTTIDSNWVIYQAEVAKILVACKGGNQDLALNLMADGSPLVVAQTAIVTSANNLKTIQSQEVESMRVSSQKTFNNSTYIIVGLSFFTIILAACVITYLLRSITFPIKKMKKALQKMAAGDLTEKIVVKSMDEVGDMARAYNDTQKYLSDLVLQLKENSSQLSSSSNQLSNASRQSSESTQQVATSSQQIAKGAQEQSVHARETAKSLELLSKVIGQLSQGANEQSAGVQKAITSIAKVSETMSRVALNASQAAQSAKQAAESANVGSQKSQQTLSGMDKIRSATNETARKIEELGTRSAEIGKIVAVIDDIAAQTNLLALNAAIEAARAGDQGRGFAVVSDEVRKLAERTAKATKEIVDLIGNVQKGVNEANQVMAGGSAAVAEGYDLAKEAGLALDQVLGASNEVNIQVEQISAKAQQVNAATNELVKVIDSVGRITEQNTADTGQMSASATQVSKAVETVAGIAEENSAATEEMSASAQEMSAQVEEIVASAQALKETAAILEQSVARFKIGCKIGDEPVKNKNK